ncbi:hypothetical protein [Streptomyces sp. NPDC088789]|uniref:hypothetical protein n=1 Tax=Streptomyces sp. NPDC088789 TaxID=3365899 RepID=UPI00380165E2
MVVAVAAAVGVAVALVVVQTQDDGGGRAGGSASVSPSTDSSPTSEETAGVSGEPGEVTEDPYPSETLTSDAPTTEPPFGYEAVEDPAGFTIAVPEGWDREAISSEYGMDVVNFRSSDGGQRLQVFEVAETSASASFELFLSDETPKGSGFQQLSYDNLATDNEEVVEGAQLEYLVDSIRGEPDVGTWHAVDARFTLSNGARYAIAAYGSYEDGEDDERELVTTALKWFYAS